MMRALIPLLLVVAPASAESEDRATAAANALRAAIKDNKPVDVASHLQAPVRYAGLELADPPCARRFGAKGTVGKAQLEAFAGCLVKVTGIGEAAWIAGVDGIDPPSTSADYFGPGGRIEVWIARTGKRAVVRLLMTPAPNDAGQNGIAGEATVVAPAVIERLLTRGVLQNDGFVELAPLSLGNSGHVDQSLFLVPASKRLMYVGVGSTAPGSPS